MQIFNRFVVQSVTEHGRCERLKRCGLILKADQPWSKVRTPMKIQPKEKQKSNLHFYIVVL